MALVVPSILGTPTEKILPSNFQFVFHRQSYLQLRRRTETQKQSKSKLSFLDMAKCTINLTKEEGKTAPLLLLLMSPSASLSDWCRFPSVPLYCLPSLPFFEVCYFPVVLAKIMQCNH